MKFTNNEIKKRKQPFKKLGGVTIVHDGEEITEFKVGDQTFKPKNGDLLTAFKKAETAAKKLKLKTKNK